MHSILRHSEDCKAYAERKIAVVSVCGPSSSGKSACAAPFGCFHRRSWSAVPFSSILNIEWFWKLKCLHVVCVCKFRFCLRPELSRSLMPDLNLEVTCWIYYWDVLNTICPPSRPKCDNLVQHVRRYCLPLVISIRFALLKLPSIPRCATVKSRDEEMFLWDAIGLQNLYFNHRKR